MACDSQFRKQWFLAYDDKRLCACLFEACSCGETLTDTYCFNDSCLRRVSESRDGVPLLRRHEKLQPSSAE